jgi:hypothetical protein
MISARLSLFLPLVAALLSSGTLHGAEATKLAVVPLVRAHSHNDYEHTRPLLDALDNGFGSVEADIYLIDGALLVAHDRKDVRPEKTLAGLYLDPLLARVKHNGGRVYPGGPTISLLIDIKTEAEPAYAVLKEVLAKYREMLTEFRPGGMEARAVTVVISGNTPRAALEKEPVRLAAADGRPNDLEANPPASLVPWVSASWGSLFKWRGVGEFPIEEKTKLREFVKKAHDQGRRIRFWAAPDMPAGWRVFFDEGVDLINTDNLPGLSAFLREQAKSPAQ